MDAPHVYVRAWALVCFYSNISTQTFRRALTASVDSYVEIECPFNGVTESGRVEEGAGKRCRSFASSIEQGLLRISGSSDT